MGHGTKSPYTPPNDIFSCLSLYLGPSQSPYGYHNEIAICVNPNSTDKLHLSYWYGSMDFRPKP